LVLFILIRFLHVPILVILKQLQPMKLLEEIFKTKILNYHALSGGSINQVYKVRTKDGVFCIKLNDANFSNNMFEAERKGLEILSESSNFTIPSVIENGTAAD